MVKNKKGFMLVEVIITSTVIITTMVFLYSNFYKLFSKYESRTNYHNIDAIYATKEMMDYLLETDFNYLINSTLYNTESIYLIQNGTCKMESKYQSFCTELSKFYNIENMIFTSYDKKNLENLANGLKDVNGNQVISPVKNETMREYINYVIGYYNITNANVDDTKNRYNYVILTELKEAENYYYANLPIR